MSSINGRSWGAGPLATVAMSVASPPINGCHVRLVPPPPGGGPGLAGLVGCGWLVGGPACGRAGCAAVRADRRAVGPTLMTFIIRSFLLLER